MLRTQLLTMKEKIAEKTQNIEQIRTNLKKSKVKMAVNSNVDGEEQYVELESQEDHLIDQTVRDMEDDGLLVEDDIAAQADSIDDCSDDDYGQEARGQFQVLNDNVTEPT